MKKVILIHGLIGHGKDEVGRMLAKHLKEEFTVEKGGFVATLKTMISALTGVKLHCVDLDSYSKPVWDFTRLQKQAFSPRWGITLGVMLQRFAQSIREGFDPDAWLKGAEIALERCESEIVIFTDMRFPDESAWGDRMMAAKIKVIRKDLPLESGRDHNHISERGLPDEQFHFIIDNSSSIENLEIAVKDIAGKLISNYKQTII
jgi:hypothetical protein